MVSRHPRHAFALSSFEGTTVPFTVFVCTACWGTFVPLIVSPRPARSGGGRRRLAGTGGREGGGVWTARAHARVSPCQKRFFSDFWLSWFTLWSRPLGPSHDLVRPLGPSHHLLDRLSSWLVRLLHSRKIRVLQAVPGIEPRPCQLSAHASFVTY